jgi:dolichol-phosphate mannosyltransferase
MTITAVIATYNEAETIGALLEGLRECRCIVVDDSSPDGTGAIVRTFAHATLLTRPAKLGIASAVLLGLRTALATETEWVVQMDAGGTHRPEDAKKMASVTRLLGADLVIGSRFTGRFDWHGRRTAISLGAAWLMRRLGLHVRDATAAFAAGAQTFCAAWTWTPCGREGSRSNWSALPAHQADGWIVEMPIPTR